MAPKPRSTEKNPASEPKPRTEKVAIAGLVMAIISAVIAGLAWWQPQHKAESDQLLDARISKLIDDRQLPLAQKIDGMSSKIDVLSGRLETIEPYVRSLVLKQMDQASSLPAIKLRSDLGQLATASSAGRAIGISIDTPTLDRLRENLSKLDFQGEPAYWTLSANLLGMRTVTIPSSRACYGVPGQHVEISAIGVFSIPFEDCSIDLSDVDGFTGGNWYRRLHDWSEGREPEITVVLTHVRVLYSGGSVLPVSKIVFNDCLFDFRLTDNPQSPAGRSLTRSLLATTNVQNVTVRVSGVAASGL